LIRLCERLAPPSRARWYAVPGSAHRPHAREPGRRSTQEAV